jgi:hypothetical protein
VKILRQICLHDQRVCEGDKKLELKRGKIYITSVPKNGHVTVFSSCWARVPAKWFGGGE